MANDIMIRDLYTMLGEKDVEILRLGRENDMLRQTVAAKNQLLNELDKQKMNGPEKPAKTEEAEAKDLES